MAGLPDTGEQQSGGPQVLLSRRQILTGTTYGIGATLLFRHVSRGRIDVPDGPARLPHPTVPARRRRNPDAAGDGRADVQTATHARQTRQTDEQRPIHRAQLSDRGQPRSVCRSDRGVLVVGQSSDGEPLGWLTDDGAQWIEHTLATPDRSITEVWGATGYDGHFVAVGSTTERAVRHVAESGIVPGVDAKVTFTERRRSPSIWWTTDCAKWTGQTFDDIVGPHAHLIAIASGKGRLVAVGSTLDSDGVQGARGLVLTSTDGAAWRQADLGAGADMAEGSFTGVAVDRDGRWYATSVDIAGGAVWTSPDGRRWSMIEASRRSLRGVALQGIGVDGRRLLVAGTSFSDPRPRYLVSHSGGRRWKRVTLDVSMLAGPEALVGDLAVISGDVVVVGTHRGAPVLEGGQLHAAD